MSLQILGKSKASPSRKAAMIFFIFLFHGVATKVQDNPNVIGAIIDANTRVGREERVSMELAVAAYNSKLSTRNKLHLQVVDSGGDPVKASTAAKGLVKNNQVEAILGMETWLEAALVAEVANRAQVPIISFAAPSITAPQTSVKWPFLVKMDRTGAPQMKCTASIVGSYEWSRVIIISEEDHYGTDSGTLKFFSDELGAAGSEVEHWLAFPSFKTLSDPKTFVQEELEILKSKLSRVFILVGCSYELAMHVLTRANHAGLMGKDSVWITTDTFANLLDAVGVSDMSSMQGIIGIKDNFPTKSPSFKNFSAAFHTLFRSLFPNEQVLKPGFYAVRAYDAISTIALALDKPINLNSIATRGKLVLENILSTNFVGLSGEIHFEDGELSRSRNYEIVNVLGKNFSIMKYWSVEKGFSDSSVSSESSGGGSDPSRVLGPHVNWPGNLERVPRGWVSSSEGDPIAIGLPGRSSFEKFVKVNYGEKPSGFCIEVFNKALSLLGYGLQYEFVVCDGSYDELVNSVHNKSFGAVVGDITILASRSDLVQFTQPYVDSGLALLVSARPEDKAWLIVKPFAVTLWLAVAGLFLYITIVVWFLEHRSNPDFQGQWRNQLCTTMWFTSSTIFFAHRENLHNNLTRLVMFIWLITVFIITSSYTASLASTLTVKRLEPTVTDIESLRTSNAHVGCDSNSFLMKYIQDVLDFHPNNIINIRNENGYVEAFKNGMIKAAFLEHPFARAIQAKYPKEYVDIGLKYKFGGLGFIFPKGSPLARDFSKAILRLSEDGTLNEIWERWFKPESPSTPNNTDNERLGLENFWLLFLLTFVISTITVVAHSIMLPTEIQSASIQSVGPTSYSNNTVQSIEVSIASNGEYSSPNTERYPPSTPLTETEIASRCRRDSDNRLRGLKVAYSFPGSGGRVNAF